MANAVSFVVNDTSPSISYFPFADTLSTPNLSAGWNPYYTLSGFVSVLGDVGDGTSLHITSDNGSSLLVHWHGTGIQLCGNVTSASFSITLDDGPPFTPAATSDNNVLLTMTDLADAPHAVTLTALIPIPEEQNPPNSSMVVFESAVLTSSPAPLNVSFSSQTIDDNGIAFLGRWSFDTAPTGASFHSSQTQGDHAVASFNGTTFLLHGITSPDSGNYTVTVDNVTTTLSAQSSFTDYDSLLFYATGLDLSTHYVQVSNSGGGNLSLLVGGFNTFAPFSTLPSPPVQTSPTSVVARGFSKGAIAAFVLAGILAFLIFSSLIFYFFFYRPRRRRRHVLAERKNRTPKEREAGVIDIGPEVDKTAQANIPIEPDQGNGGYGFSRWKRGAVDGSPGELSLPIRFQRSDSIDEKFASPMNEVPFDDISDLSTNSSAKRKAQAKSKGKARQITGRSYSPGRIVSFNRSRLVQQHLSTNTAESLGVSTFIAADPPSAKNVAPPSYAASVSIRDSKSTTNGNPVTKSSSNRSMPSVPHSVSPFPDDQDHPPQKQDQTGAILLPQGELSYEQGSSENSSPHRLKPPHPTPMNSLTRIDRGSEVGDNMDDTLPASLQQAIRSLSPRPVRHPYANQDEDSIHTPSPQNASFLEDAVLTLLPESPSNNDDLVEVRDGVFLSVGPPSPFQVTFDPKPHTSNKSNSGGLSYTSTPSDSKTTDGSSGPPNPDDGMGPMQASSDFVQGSSNMRFRLTPLSIPPTVAVDPPSNSAKDSEGVMSFLDFSSSREGSLASRSAWSEERQRGSLDPPVEEKSRWSNTTVPSMKSKSSQLGNNSNASGNGSSDGSNKISESRSAQSTIPIRVSIPSSYDNSIVSAGRSRTSGLTTGDTLHVHPPFESLESPTESMSIPMSAVSELHFRQSVSEENVGFNSRRTTESSLVFVSSSHPPLPTRHDENTPRPFDPSILVNRVLGLPPPTMTTRTTNTTTTGTAAAAAYPSPPVSSLSPFASPHASRFITNIRGDRVNSQNSGTESLEP